jgi:hypothetical protein
MFSMNISRRSWSTVTRSGKATRVQVGSPETDCRRRSVLAERSVLGEVRVVKRAGRDVSPGRGVARAPPQVVCPLFAHPRSSGPGNSLCFNAVISRAGRAAAHPLAEAAAYLHIVVWEQLSERDRPLQRQDHTTFATICLPQTTVRCSGRCRPGG